MIIFLSYLGFIIALMLCFGAVLRNSYRNQAIQRRIAQVQSQCNILASQILLNEFKIASATDNLSIEIDQLANVYEGRIIVVDSRYQIIKDTYTIEENKYILSKNVHDMMKGVAGSNYHLMEDGVHAEVLVPIVETTSTASDYEAEMQNQSTEPIKGVVICVVTLRDQLDTIDYVGQQASNFYAAFFMLAVLLAFIMAIFIPRPFKRLNQRLTHVADGHFDEEMDVRGVTEERDITESLNRIFRQIQVMENSRQEFVSNVSHELKTPITSMKVLSDSLLMQEDVPAEMYREFMTDLSGEIDRENKIITDLLTLVRLNKKSVELNIETMSINALIEQLMKRIRPIAAGREIELIFESIREVEAEVDETKLSLALNNLIVNAVKYNVDQGWVRVTLDADHKFFYVKIADSGVGIPEEAQEKIFERFYRVDTSHSTEISGTGLGLSITRSAILAHKGAITVYSKEGEGTTFTVRVPIKYIP